MTNVNENYPYYWKPVPGYENLFASRTKKLMLGCCLVHQIRTAKGYLSVYINGKRIFSHVLIGLAFVPNPENKPYINHKNGKKRDNRPCNLEWVTTRENTMHAWYELGKDGYLKKRAVRIFKDGLLFGETRSVQNAAKLVKGYTSCISKCCQGRKNDHKGYTFEYI